MYKYNRYMCILIENMKYIGVVQIKYINITIFIKGIEEVIK